MQDIVQQVAIVVGLLAVSFAGPMLAIAFLLIRKRRARALRRSPIGIDLLRSPGHALRDQIEDANVDVLSDVFVLMFVPLLALCVFFAQQHFQGAQRMLPLAPIFAVIVLIFVGAWVRKLWKTGEKLDRLKAGYDAELAVGQELDQLMREGAFVFHDFPADNFNIDHVVVAVQGIFAVETKGFTKPNRGRGRVDATVSYDGKMLRFPTWSTDAPLEQADRQAVWLSQWLSRATAVDVRALPVLALPGWFVELGGKGSVSVYNGRQLSQLLRSRHAHALSEQEMQRVVHQVEQRCRTVAPQYARLEKAK